LTLQVKLNRLLVLVLGRQEMMSARQVRMALEDFWKDGTVVSQSFTSYDRFGDNLCISCKNLYLLIGAVALGRKKVLMELPACLWMLQHLTLCL
jgi:hypothetical protein